tara:strand:- start:13 stop:336 length:324 start_codon:yes stop_codon:yes gene_type:complete
MATKKTTYKCRAEVLADCIKFKRKANINNNDLYVEWSKFREPIMTFKSSKTIEELILIADSIVDCHVLMGTIQPINSYTGERVWCVYKGKVDTDDNIFLKLLSAIKK